MTNKAVSIIIPIYNAFEATLECIQSVLTHTSSEVRIIAIDDKSSNGSFREYFNKNSGINRDAHPANLLLLENNKNLGFVGTCNRGMMLESGSDDIVLLNSDAVVTKNWVNKLQYAAYRAHNIATVTPLTNNGTICSIPVFLSDNELPDFINLDEYAELVEKTSKRQYPTIPTCVGFCVYIKREVLEKTGYFDPLFSKGYGEENDLSLRCQKMGYIDILDDTTFIHHKGSLSFGDMKNQLSKDNSAIISERYPNYFPDVSQFCSQNPLEEIQVRIQNALVAEYEKQNPSRVLHILHNGPFAEYNHGLGGTEMHVRELITGIKGVSHWSLVTKIGPPQNTMILTAHLGSLNKTIRINAQPNWLQNIIQPEFFETIHIHHTMHFDRQELSELCSKHPNVIYSIHDYFSLCPFIYMRTKTEKVCSGVECTVDCKLESDYINKFRLDSQKILTNARHVAVFSESSREIVKKIFGQQTAIELIPHGIKNIRSTAERQKKKADGSIEKPLKVAFLSPLVYHKGKSIILDSSKIKFLPNGKPVEWHIWSEIDEKQLLPDSLLISHGRYDQARIGQDLYDYNIDLIVIPSICMETFSYTLTEAWNAGLPVIVTPYGALRDRVQETGAGWILTDESSATLHSLLSQISDNNSQEYSIKLKAAQNAALMEAEKEAQTYRRFYLAATPDNNSVSILKHLQTDFCTPGVPAPPPAEVQPEISGISRIRNFIIESSRW